MASGDQLLVSNVRKTILFANNFMFILEGAMIGILEYNLEAIWLVFRSKRVKNHEK